MGTDVATVAGGDERKELGGGKRAGAGVEVDTGMQLVTGSALGSDVRTDTVTEVLTCCGAPASVWFWV